MEIILKQYLKGLGDKDDIVNVKNGYGRNYLIPNGFAVLATASAKKVVAENVKQAGHRQDHILKEAQKIADKINSLDLSIETLAGQDGKLFGSVTALMIENSLRENGIEVDRRRITVPEVKEIGTYTAEIDIRKDVKAELNFKVVAKQD